MSCLGVFDSGPQAPYGFPPLPLPSLALPHLSLSLLTRRQRSGEFQCLVISLKDMFYENANALVGVCR